jgi:hypothetical protein
LVYRRALSAAAGGPGVSVLGAGEQPGRAGRAGKKPGTNHHARTARRIPALLARTWQHNEKSANQPRRRLDDAAVREQQQQLQQHVSSLNTQQLLAYRLIERALKENASAPKRGVIIAGVAGTGKSYVIHTARALARVTYNTENDVIAAVRVCAADVTGVAAFVAGGETIAIVFGNYDNNKGTTSRMASQSKGKRSRLGSMRLLMLDELRTLNSKTLDYINRQLRLAKDAPDAPFGGVQVVAVGDPLQLGPVTGHPLWVLPPHAKEGESHAARTAAQAGHDSWKSVCTDVIELT